MAFGITDDAEEAGSASKSEWAELKAGGSVRECEGGDLLGIAWVGLPV